MLKRQLVVKSWFVLSVLFENAQPPFVCFIVQLV